MANYYFYTVGAIPVELISEKSNVINNLELVLVEMGANYINVYHKNEYIITSTIDFSKDFDLLLSYLIKEEFSLDSEDLQQLISKHKSISYA